MFLQILKIILVLNCVIGTLALLLVFIEFAASKLDDTKDHVIWLIQKINNTIHDNKIRSDAYIGLLNQIRDVVRDEENIDDKSVRRVIYNRIVKIQNDVDKKVCDKWW